MRSYFVGVLAVAISLILSGCGKENEGGDQGGEREGSRIATGVIGEWRGTMEDRRDGSQADPVTVELTLSENGEMHLTAAGDADAIMVGTYADFGDSVLFSIHQSSISLLGSGSSERSLKYSRLGKNLRLFDNRVEILLALKSTLSPSSDDLTAVVYAGNWTGNDANGNRWSVSLNGDRFTARVEDGQNAALNLGGPIAFEDESKTGGILKVETSNDLSVVGTEVGFSIVDQKTMKLTGPNKESFNLSKSL